MPDRIDIGYAWEKTQNAIHGMAINPGSLRERIVSAYVYSLMNIHPERNLPPDLHALFQQIRDVFHTTAATGDEGGAMASVNAMDDRAVQEVARKILQLKDQVAVAYQRERDGA